MISDDNIKVDDLVIEELSEVAGGDSYSTESTFSTPLSSAYTFACIS